MCSWTSKSRQGHSSFAGLCVIEEVEVVQDPKRVDVLEETSIVLLPVNPPDIDTLGLQVV